MIGPELDADNPAIDMSIRTGHGQTDEIVKECLENLEIEAMVRRTLQIVQVQEQVMLTVVVIGDEEMQALNKQYRQQDKPTDVLSFPLLDLPLVKATEEYLWQEAEGEEVGESEETNVPQPAFVTPEGLPTNLGDIVISWPTVQIQANAAGHSDADEFLFLLCHGVLHLVGYDDQTEAGYGEMVRLQKQILSAENHTS